jgi:uncharacterized protein YndB with AHSA1/START domain
MAYESLSLSELIPATGEDIYSAWLSSAEHTAFTGNAASIDPVVGGRHSTFNGYAQGSIVDLQPPQRIVQTWRTTDFPQGAPDSRLEITLEPTVGGTMVTLLQTDIPEGQSDNYRDGWVKYYLEPLKTYFRDKNATVIDVEATATRATESDGATSVDAVAPVTKRAKTPKPAAPPAATKAKPKGQPKAKPTAKAKAKPAAKAKAKPKAKKSLKSAKQAKKAPSRVKVKAKAKAASKPKTKTAKAKRKSGKRRK